MKMLKIAAVAAFLPVAAFADAHSDDVAMMGEGLSMLGTSAQNAFESMGIDADANDLTVAQLAQIHGILGGDESPAEMTNRIEAIIENN